MTLLLVASLAVKPEGGALLAEASTREVVLAVVKSDYNKCEKDNKIAMGFDLDRPKKAAKSGAVAENDDDAMDIDKDSDKEDNEKKKDADAKKEEGNGKDKEEEEDDKALALSLAPLFQTETMK